MATPVPTIVIPPGPKPGSAGSGHGSRKSVSSKTRLVVLLNCDDKYGIRVCTAFLSSEAFTP